MSIAYYISNSQPIAKGDAISCRHFEHQGKAPWRRAFFQRVLDTSTIDGVFDGDLVVIFEGMDEESYVRPSAAYGVMVRNR